jgi:hypothetical protein
MRYSRVALCALPTLLALATGATAQERRHIDVEARVTVEHDSNVARSNAALAAARGIERADTIIRPSLAIDLFMPLSRQSLFLRGSVGHDYYRNNDILDSDRFDVVGGANLHVALCEGMASVGYQRQQSDLQDLSLLTVRNIQKLNQNNFNVSCGRAVGFAPSFAIEDVTARNDNPALVSSDYDMVATTVGLGYRRPSFGVVSAFWRHSDSEYRNRLVLVGANLINDGYETDAYGIRYVRRLGARIEGEGFISQTKVKPDSSTTGDFSGLTYGAEVDFRVSSRIKTSARLARDVSPTIRLGGEYAVNQTAQLDATYAMNARWTLNAGLSQGTSRYKGAALGTTDLTKEDLLAIYGGARWDVGRRVAFLADVRHEERDANVAGFDYSSTRAGLTAIAKF